MRASSSLFLAFVFVSRVLSYSQSAPQIVGTSPTQNELDVSVSATVSVTFDFNMDESTINDSTFVVHGGFAGLWEGTIAYDNATKTATFECLDDFHHGETITVLLTDDIESFHGIPLDNSYAWSFTVEADNGAGSFAPHLVYSVADGPQSVFAADLEGDGDLDLATANWFSNDVSILLNNADATFPSDTAYPVAAWPYSVSGGDLDADGDVDLVTANWFSNNVSVLLNDGEASFTAESVYPVAARPYSICVGDLDGDGDLDLATANEITNNISVLLNDGGGTFAMHTDYPAGDYPTSVSVGDLDGDGDLDLATGNQSSDNVSVLLNNGNGTFATHVDYPAGDRPYSLFTADLDGDGDLDLTTANLSSDSISVLLNNGDGSFAAHTNWAVGGASRSVFASDVDGDGDLDLVAAVPAQDKVSVLINGGAGSFSSYAVYQTGDNPISVFAADLDGDGDLDLATTNVESDNVSVLLNRLISVDSIWALPDSVIIGQDVSLYMRVENTGSAQADSVVPQIGLLGDGSASLNSGPTPEYAHLMPGSDVVFSWQFTTEAVHWVYWRGFASAKDHNSGSQVTCLEDTSNRIFIQTAPDITFILGSVDPDTLTQGQTAAYTMAVKNDGEAWLKISPQTTFRFNDATGDTLRTHLSDSVLVAGLASNVMLTFDTARVPRNMVAGDWLSWLSLDGAGRNDYRHSYTLAADFLTIQERPEIEDAVETVTPPEVSQGQNAAFTIEVSNSGGVGVILNTTSHLSFTDGTWLYDADLSGEDTLEVGVSCRLSFASAPVPPAILSGAYPVTLHLYGTDFNGAEYGDTVITTGRNWVTVKTPARFEILAVIAGSDTVSWGEANVPVDVVVQNGGGADASLDSTNLRFLRGTDNLDDDFLETLLNSIDLVRGTCTEILHFSVKVDSSDTTGWATIHSRVFGSDKNSGEPICDTTADLPDSFYVTAGYACGDCNGDGNIAFMDALYLVCFMYRSGPMPLGSGDVNLDGRITFADALQIKNYFYQTPPGSPAPCQPRASSRRVIDGAHRDR